MTIESFFDHLRGHLRLRRDESEAPPGSAPFFSAASLVLSVALPRPSALERINPFVPSRPPLRMAKQSSYDHLVRGNISFYLRIFSLQNPLQLE
jgi:hypothetical protein